MKRKSVAIVGAGVGGLAAAARLAAQGFDVEVFEKSKNPGGRCGQLIKDGFSLDTGPTLLLMPEVLEQTFAAVGRKLSDYLELTRCEPNYRIRFHDGSDVTLGGEIEGLQRELERIEPGSFRRFLDFLSQGNKQYHTSLDAFVSRNYDTALEFAKPSILRKVFDVRAHRRMYPEVSRFFADPRLRAAFTFQTMYLGISPFESPAVYGLLPYTELVGGIWFPKGGLYAVPKALEKVGRELGVQYHYGAQVKRVVSEPGRVKGIELADGTQAFFDAVVCNADLPWAYENLIDGEHTRLPRAEKLRYTSSAYMIYAGVRRKLPELLHHNVFLGEDYRGSFEDIFDRKRVPADPSFYVNVPSRTDPTLAPPGCDGMYILVPVPHCASGLDWTEEGKRIRAHVFAKLAEVGVRDLDRDLVFEKHFTPNDWRDALFLARGSAFGLSHHFFQVGPFRPANQDPKLRNLFFVGASTQPGTGLPMVMLSAQLVTERVQQQFGEQPAPVRAIAPREQAA